MFDSSAAPLRAAMFAACLTGVLAACSTLPRYSVPEVDVPAHYAAAQPSAGWAVASPADDAPRGASSAGDATAQPAEGCAAA